MIYENIGSLFFSYIFNKRLIYFKGREREGNHRNVHHSQVWYPTKVVGIRGCGNFPCFPKCIGSWIISRATETQTDVLILVAHNASPYFLNS